MGDLHRQRVIAFLGAQVAYAGLALSALQLETVETFFAQHLMWVVAAAVVIEVATLASIAFLFRSQSNPTRGARTSNFAISADAVQVRFSQPRDMDQLEAVYLEWFSADLSICDAEIIGITARGNHERVAEYIFEDGNRSIEGYYSIWPMTSETYAALKSGELKEKDLNCQKVLPIGSKDGTVLYVSEICARDDHVIRSILVKDMRRYIRQLVYSNTSIEMLATWAYTNDGRQLAVKSGMLAASGLKKDHAAFFEMGRKMGLARLKNEKTFEPVLFVSL